MTAYSSALNSCDRLSRSTKSGPSCPRIRPTACCCATNWTRRPSVPSRVRLMCPDSFESVGEFGRRTGADAEPVSEFCRSRMGAILIHDVPHGFVVERAEAQLLGDRVVQLGRRAIKGSKRP